MSRKVVSLKQASSEPRPRSARGAMPRTAASTLGAGLYPAHIVSSTADAFVVRMADRRRLEAVVDEDVDRALVEECLREGRRVVLADGERGPAIVGALQTKPSLARQDDGSLVLDARDIRLRASGTLALEAGPVVVRVDKQGVLRLEGDRLVVDMGSVVRFVSARVELP